MSRQSRASAGFILSIDVGTSGARAVWYDMTGHEYGTTYREYQYRILSATEMEQDAETWLCAVDEVLRGALNQLPGSPSDVLGISVTSQRATLIPVDRHGTPLAPALVWHDKRTHKQCQRIEAAIGKDEVYRRTGLRIDPYFSLPKLLWYQEERPEVFAQTEAFLAVSDLVVHFLTGEMATDFTQASRTMLFDIKTMTWAHDFARAVGLPIEKMPDPMPPGSRIGGLSAEVASRYGLLAGTPVIAAGGDQQSAALGLGLDSPGKAEVTTGTGSFLVFPVSSPVFDAEQRVVCSVSAAPGVWLLEAGLFTSGSLYRWLRDLLYAPHDAAASAATSEVADIYERMNREAASVPAGAGGLVAIPHFAGSAAPYWNPAARGVLMNLQLSHGRGHVIRAVLEGIVMEVNKNLHIMRELSERGGDAARPSSEPLEELRVSGGLSRSAVFNQIQADVYGLPVVPDDSGDCSAKGAAILASVNLGIYNDLHDACQSMVHLQSDELRAPIPKNHTIYQKVQTLHDATYRALEAANVYRLAVDIAQGLSDES